MDADRETLKSFVRQRIGETQQLLPQAEWRHVNGNHNPADLMTRGMTTKAYYKSEVGAQNGWLHQPTGLWPLNMSTLEQLPEVSDCAFTLTAASLELDSVIQIERYISRNKLFQSNCSCTTLCEDDSWENFKSVFRKELCIYRVSWWYGSSRVILDNSSAGWSIRRYCSVFTGNCRGKTPSIVWQLHLKLEMEFCVAVGVSIRRTRMIALSILSYYRLVIVLQGW